MKRFFSLIVLCLMIIPFGIAETNGTNVMGYGTKSQSMGGADAAWINDINAINLNPAGLGFINGNTWGLSLSLLTPAGHHTDVFGNDMDNETRTFPLPTLGVAFNLSPQLTMGLGVFAHGGMGVTYENMNTAFGTVDRLHDTIMHIKVSPALAFKPVPGLSIGASLEFSYAMMELEFFPDTSVPAAGFMGMATDDATATSVGYRVGFMFKPSDAFSIGAYYLAKTNFEFEGTLDMDFSGMGLGKVTFDALLTDLNWPQMIDAGIAFKPFKNLMVAVDVTWMNWEDAMHENHLSLTNASIPFIQDIDMVFENFWEDQIIYAFGIDFALNPGISIQAGYNYGKNPIPNEYLNSLFAATAAHHISFGASMKTPAGSEYMIGIVIVPYEEITFTNMTMPYGPNAISGQGQLAINFGANFAL